MVLCPERDMDDRWSFALATLLTMALAEAKMLTKTFSDRAVPIRVAYAIREGVPSGCSPPHSFTSVKNLVVNLYHHHF